MNEEKKTEQPSPRRIVTLTPAGEALWGHNAREVARRALRAPDVPAIPVAVGVERYVRKYPAFDTSSEHGIHQPEHQE